ncbi:putative Ferric-chelate reductase [Mycena chlorophos]|uniref:Putative Ferric-chelate reductase n=1 Tax=Mycena chlorophos TaxID=658473 RepID=A0A8H6SNQ3_MYCCL|nr:putative Ferric-chelate reductase [Mycena chlorophos]
MLFALPAVCLLFAIPVYARWEWVCGLTCERFFPGSYSLNCSDPSISSSSMSSMTSAVTPACEATNMPYLTSQAWCLHERCEPLGGLAKVEWYWAFLQWEGGVTYPSYTSVLPSTYRIGDAEWELNYNSNWVYNQNDVIRVEQGWGWTVAFGAFLLLISAMRLVARLSSSKYNPSSWRSNWLISAWKKHLRYPALFGRRHHVPYRGGLFTAPPRLLSLFVFLNLALGLIFVSVQQHSIQPNSIYANRFNEMLNNIGLAAGDLAMAVFVLVWLTAGRNNPFQWTTGWGYETFQVMHRWISRLAFFYSLLHTVCYTYLDVRRKYWTEAYLNGPWFIWGCVGMVALFILVFSSLRPIRERMYETFLVVHVLMAVFTIVGTQLHIIFLYGHHYNYRNWLWGPVALWSIDRFVRLVRMYVMSSGEARNIVVAAVPDTDGTVLRITVPKPRAYTPAPGHHFFLYFPNIGIAFWQNHPLSIAGWTAGDAADAEGGKNKNKTELTMYMVGRKGQTGDLAAIVHSNDPKPTRVTCLLEGPYGQAHPLGDYESVVLVAGGVGIGATLSYVHAHAANPGRTKRLVLLFVARHVGFLREAERHLQAAGLEDLLELQLFCSRGQTELEEGAEKEKEEDAITFARPDLAEVIPAEIAAAPARVAFFVCGPGSLNDAVRYEVVQSIGTVADGDKVAFFEEALGW